MRFPLLKPGQKFLYQQKRYTKTGPMTATEEESGKQCMIRRSAEVTPLDSHSSIEQPVTEQFPRQQVVDLLKAYQSELKLKLAQSMEAEETLQPTDILQLVDGFDVQAFVARIDRSGAL